MSQLVEDLKACKAELERRGWTQQNLVTADGRACMLGAIGCALLEGFADQHKGRYSSLMEDPRASGVIKALAKHLPRPIGSPRDEIDQIFMVNDARDTTVDDVFNFFDKALAEQGGL